MTLHDRPTAAELVAAVREYLERDVMTATEGRVAFHARVAVNVLGMVERELELGAAQDAAEHDRLVALLGRDGTVRELTEVLAARHPRRVARRRPGRTPSSTSARPSGPSSRSPTPATSTAPKERTCGSPPGTSTR